MKWICTCPVVCVYGPAGWELLLGEVVCKSRGIVAKSNKALVSVTCCSGSVNPVCNAISFLMLPSSSFLYLYCMALRILGFYQLDQIGVFCL
jgi:hypothetical protein